MSTQTELLGLLTQIYYLLVVEDELVSVELAVFVLTPPGVVALPRLELLLVLFSFVTLVLLPVLVPVWSLLPP